MFQKFETFPNKPWLTVDQTFLLFDYVHLLKNVRNNWITEKSQKIAFQIPGLNDETHVAKWEDLIQLFRLEASHCVSLSRLDSKSINPKPIERQNVTTCLRVFSDETLAALKTHPAVNQDEVRGTAAFIKIFIDLWKILNVHSLSEANRLRDQNRAVFTSPDDPRLASLISIAEMTEAMNANNGKNRCMTFTKDTANALSHTLRGMVDLVKSLLQNSHDFVMLGEFSTDPLEKAFSKLRQGAGGAYFISVQQALEKVRIEHTKILLRFDSDFLNLLDGHKCDNCERKLTNDECELLDNLPSLEESVTTPTKMALIYIAGYLEKKMPSDEDDTHSYYECYGTFLDNLSRGGQEKTT